MSEATQTGAEQSIHDRLLGVIDPEEQEEPEQVEESEPEEVEESEVEEDSEEVVSEEDATDEVDEPSVQLSDLSQYLGVDPDRLDVGEDGTVWVKTKVDGEEGRAKFADLIKSYQLEGHLNKQNMEVAEQRKALEQARAEFESKQQQEIQRAEDLANLAWGQLTKEYQSVNWEELRQEDPAEYAAKSQDFNRRQQELQHAYGQIQAQRNQSVQKHQEQIQARLRDEQSKLLSAIPEWTDQSVAQKEREGIREFAQSLGFTDQDLNSVIDHRQVLILRDAMKYRQLQKSKAEVSKKVSKAPKLVKPGQAPSKADSDQKAAEDQRKALKRNGSKRGALAEYLLASGKI